MKTQTLRSRRNSPLWYGWKIRAVWLVSGVLGLLSKEVKGRCQEWAMAGAYRLGRQDYGAHLNTPRFSRRDELTNAYDSGAYDFWLGRRHTEHWTRSKAASGAWTQPSTRALRLLAGWFSSNPSDACLRPHWSPTLGEELIDPGVDARPVAVQPRSIGRLPFQIEGLQNRRIDPMGDQVVHNRPDLLPFLVRIVPRELHGVTCRWPVRLVLVSPETAALALGHEDLVLPCYPDAAGPANEAGRIDRPPAIAELRFHSVPVRLRQSILPGQSRADVEAEMAFLLFPLHDAIPLYSFRLSVSAVARR